MSDSTVRSISRPCSAFVPSRRMTIGTFMSTRDSAVTIPLATSSPRVIPPKMLMKMERTLGSELMTSRALAITSALAPPPMSRKLAGRPPTWLTTSQVLMASPAPLAIIPTKPSRPTYCRPTWRAWRSRSSSSAVSSYSAHSGWRKAALSSRVTLASRACTRPSGVSIERVHLDQVGVAFHETAVKAEQHVDRTRPRLLVDGGLFDQMASLSLAETFVGVDVEAGDGAGVLDGHLFDVDAAFGRDHRQVRLGAPVEREAGVVLLGDVGGMLDPYTAHQVALDVHPEDGRSVRACLGCVGGQFDPARLAAAAHLDLGLHHHRVAEALRQLDGFVRRQGDSARRHRYAVAGEILLALVLQQVHWVSLGTDRTRLVVGR